MEKELDEIRKEVKELMKELKAMDMARKPVGVKSYHETTFKNLKEKVDHKRKVLEMNQLMFEVESGGRSLDDLSQTELRNLISYINEKIAGLSKLLGYPEHPDAPEGGPYLHPSDEDDDEMKTDKGESIKSGGADDA